MHAISPVLIAGACPGVLFALSRKRRGFCPCCGGRRTAETAALLVEEVSPKVAIRQWVLSLLFALCYLLATRPEVVTQILGIVYRAISGHLIRKAGLTRKSAATGALRLNQSFGSALNANVHFHMLVPASEWLALTESGQARLTLKMPYRDGTTHISIRGLGAASN
jgi:hypothetical protein